MYGEADLPRALNIADYLLMEEFPDERYATALVSIFDPQARTLRSAAAGHPGPLLWVPSKNTVIDPFQSRGLPLGMRGLADYEPEPCTVALEPGSLAVYFTDGLLEWERDYLEGEAALYEALAREDVRTARHPAKALRQAVVRGKHQDDIAVLTLRVEGPEAPGGK